MNRWFVTFAWMIVLALPLQGLAAASRLMCHHAQTGPVAAASTEAADADVDATAPCHGQAQPEAAHAGCIACAACHGIAALPATRPVVLPGLPGLPPAAVGPPSVSPYVTTAPERPPRSPRA